MRNELLSGDHLVSAIWSQIGVALVFVGIIVVLAKHFIGAGKNVSAGIAAIIGIAVVATIAANPAMLLTVGSTILGWIGL